MDNLKTGLLGILSAAFIPVSAFAAETELVMNIFLPQQHFLYAELTEWGKEVEKVTEGRVAITVPAGSLAPPPQQYGAVTSGVADIAVTANIFIQRKEPLIAVSQLPWLTISAEDASIALWKTYQDKLEDKGLFADVKLLSLFHFGGGQAITFDDTPINSLSDLKARKVWALPGASAKLLVEEGISPVTTPAVQVSEPVSSGVVNGVFGLSLESARDFRIGNYIKTVTEFPTWISVTSFSMVMNLDKWNSISEQDRAAISAISGVRLAKDIGAAADAEYQNARDEFVAAGVSFVPADPAFFDALQKPAAALYADFEKEAERRGVDGADLIETFKANLRDASK